jgi:hypothetical protein
VDDRARILALAAKGTKIKAIAERIGCKYDRVRQLILRAEQSGKVPLGTLTKCLDKLPTPIEATPTAPRSIVCAPPRSHAATLGSCNVYGCRAPTAVVVHTCDVIRLCELHAEQAIKELAPALKAAKKSRRI